jgi:hypothetical protein
MPGATIRPPLSQPDPAPHGTLLRDVQTRVGRLSIEKLAHRHCRLLRACRKGPRSRRTAEQRDELASPHMCPSAEDHTLPHRPRKSRVMHHSKFGSQCLSWVGLGGPATSDVCFYPQHLPRSRRAAIGNRGGDREQIQNRAFCGINRSPARREARRIGDLATAVVPHGATHAQHEIRYRRGPQSTGVRSR